MYDEDICLISSQLNTANKFTAFNNMDSGPVLPELENQEFCALAKE